MNLKPAIKRDGGGWFCSRPGDVRGAWGVTPQAAYETWKRVKDIRFQVRGEERFASKRERMFNMHTMQYVELDQ